MNRHPPHVYVIPEDDADRQLAEGFVEHFDVDERRIKVMPPARGWPNVLKLFEDKYIRTMQNNPHTHVVMLVDFDGCVPERRGKFEVAIPEDVKARVFVIGSLDDPETLKRMLKKSLSQIGTLLAGDCAADTVGHWNHEQLQHNDSERQGLVRTIKSFLFKSTNLF